MVIGDDNDSEKIDHVVMRQFSFFILISALTCCGRPSSIHMQQDLLTIDAMTNAIYACRYHLSSPRRPVRSIIHDTESASRVILLDSQCLQTLGVLDRNSLDIAVKLLLCALLIITLSRDAHTESVRNTLDTLLPDLLVQLRIEADVLGALSRYISISLTHHCPSNATYHLLVRKLLDLLDSTWCALLEAHAVDLEYCTCRISLPPNAFLP